MTTTLATCKITVITTTILATCKITVITTTILATCKITVITATLQLLSCQLQLFVKFIMLLTL